jgi:hypothetical protein
MLNLFLAIGERGIRTLGTEILYNRLAIYRDRPLCHLSNFFLLKKILSMVLFDRKDENNGWLRLDLNLRPRAYESPTLTN